MRSHSVYEFQCECGATVQTEEPHATCPSCGREIRLIWRAEEETSVQCPVSSVQ